MRKSRIRKDYMVTLMLQMAENIKNDKTELEEFQETLYHQFYMNLIQNNE